MIKISLYSLILFFRLQLFNLLLKIFDLIIFRAHDIPQTVLVNKKALVTEEANAAEPLARIAFKVSQFIL